MYRTRRRNETHFDAGLGIGVCIELAGATKRILTLVVFRSEFLAQYQMASLNARASSFLWRPTRAPKRWPGGPQTLVARCKLRATKLLYPGHAEELFGPVSPLWWPGGPGLSPPALTSSINVQNPSARAVEKRSSERLATYSVLLAKNFVHETRVRRCKILGSLPLGSRGTGRDAPPRHL